MKLFQCVFLLIFFEFVPKGVFSKLKSPLSIGEASTQMTGSGSRQLSSTSVETLINFLISNSPDHVLYLLHDNTFTGTGKIVEACQWTGLSIMLYEFTPGLIDFYELLSFPPSSVSTARRHILLLCTLENVEAVFRMVSQRNLESNSVWWIVFAIKEAIPVLEEIIREGSQVILIQVQENDSFIFFGTKINHGGMVKFQEIDKLLISSKGPQEVDGDIFVDLEDAYADFQGRQLIVSTLENPPFFMMEKQENGEVLGYAGIDYYILKSFSEVLNFTFRLEEPPDGKWGGPLENGTVVGMIGEVAKRKAHFSICEITITGLRETVIDFSYPYYMESLTLIFSKT